MSNQAPGPEFWNRVNTLINTANAQCDTADPSEVSASMMYAAARFNAFVVARSTGTPQNMQHEKERALDYFIEQFRAMMTDNFDDFIANMEKYIPQAPQ